MTPAAARNERSPRYRYLGLACRDRSHRTPLRTCRFPVPSLLHYENQNQGHAMTATNVPRRDVLEATGAERSRISLAL